MKQTYERDSIVLPRRLAVPGILLGLGASAIALGAAPALIPPSYSWVAETTSESAAQGVHGAWLARLGFLLFASSVLWLAHLAITTWGRGATACLGTFGVMLVATAAFSHRPWEPGADFDRTEDLLHSITATVMGMAFTVGVVLIIVNRARRGERFRLLDGVAVAVAIVIPLSMSRWPDQEGILQRGMFAVSYLWFAIEAIQSTGDLRSDRGSTAAG